MDGQTRTAESKKEICRMSAPENQEIARKQGKNMRNTWFLGVFHEKSCIKFNVLASAGLGGGYADVP
jgi:hypothetical protein